jgi:hypothetical protein
MMKWKWRDESIGEGVPRIEAGGGGPLGHPSHPRFFFTRRQGRFPRAPAH